MAETAPRFEIKQVGSRWVIEAPDGAGRLTYHKTVELWDEGTRRMRANRIEYVFYPSKAAALKRLAEYAWLCHTEIQKQKPAPPEPIPGQRNLYQALHEQERATA